MNRNFFLKIKVLSVFFASILIAEQGSISGRVTSEGSNLYGANVFLIGTSMGAVTDSLGNYHIKNIPVGKYQVRVDYIGYESKQREVYISLGQQSIINEEETSSSFSSKLGLDELVDDEMSFDKSSNLFDINFDLQFQVLEVSQVVVSASRREEKIIDAVANITAVSESKIRRGGGGDFGMVLKTAKGVDVYQAGMGRTSINTRGFMSAFNERFVAMKDGMYLNDPVTGNYSMHSPIINDDIERIEIVFGPSSAIYGPNAHNGLMNIITKHPKDMKSNIFMVESGPNNYASQNLRYVKNYEQNFGFKLSISNKSFVDWNPNKEHGYDVDGDQIVSQEERIEVFNTEKELKVTSLNIDFNSYYSLSNKTEFSLGGGSQSSYGYFPYDIAVNLANNQINNIWMKYKSPNVFVRYSYKENRFSDNVNLGNVWDAEWVDTTNSVSRQSLISQFDEYQFSTYNNRLELQFNNRLMNFDFVYGFDYSNTNPNTKGQFLNDRGPIHPAKILRPADSLEFVGEDINITEYGAYLQTSRMVMNDIKVLGALRYDKHSYFDAQLSPRLALQWNGLDAGHIRVSYNKAFQIPSLYSMHAQMYAPPAGDGWFAVDADGIINWWDPENNGFGNRLQQWFFANNTNGDNTITSDELNIYNSVRMQGVLLGNKDGLTINDSLHIPGLKIEEVESYDIALKKLMFGKLFIDISAFYSTYKNFKTPLQRMNQLVYQQAPYGFTSITNANGSERGGNEWVLSFLSLRKVTTYGLDLYFKYVLNKENDELTFGYSYYGTDNIDDQKSDSSAFSGANFFVGDELLKPQGESNFDPYSDLIYFNAPNHKYFVTYLNNKLFRKGYMEISANYKSPFDFVSGMHVHAGNLSIQSPGFTSGAPNPYYENTGAMGGDFIIDFLCGYRFMNNIDLNFRINNLTDEKDVIAVGTPPSRRFASLGFKLTF